MVLLQLSEMVWWSAYNYGSTGTSGRAITPRSTTKACVDFICEDLERSAQLLAPFTENGGWPSSDFGRVTSGTALALKGRTLLLYASPLFNRKNDVERWRKAYNEITADLPRINACGYGLANESNAGANASGWANVFQWLMAIQKLYS